MYFPYVIRALIKREKQLTSKKKNSQLYVPHQKKKQKKKNKNKKPAKQKEAPNS